MSGLEERNELPTGWAWTTIGSIAEVNPPRPRYETFTDDEPVTFIPMAAVSDESGTVVWPEERTLGSIRSKSYRTFTSDDVLFAKITPCMENGKSAIVPSLSNGLGFGSTEFHVVRASASVLPQYLWRFVRQESYRSAAEANMSGSVGQMRVPAEYVRDSRLPLPPRSEQKAIIDLIDAIEERRASASDHIQVATRTVHRFRQAVLAAACSGRLTAEWRDQHPEARSVGLDIARQRRKMQMGRRFREPSPNAHADMASLPERWEVGPLGLLLSAIKYGTSKRSEYGVPGTSVLRIPNVSGERLDVSDLKATILDASEADSLRLRLGDLLMIRSNGSVQLVGKILPVTEEAVGMAYAGYLMRLRTDDELLNHEFLAMALASPLLRRQIEMPARSTSGVNNINTDEVRGLILPIPPLDEQREIVRRTSEMFDSANILLTRIETASRRVNRSSQAVLAKAFRGELIPGRAQPEVGVEGAARGRRKLRSGQQRGGDQLARTRRPLEGPLH